ncbi:MAG: adenylate/guanylate cyclase domain-containing protein [Alphaproteobacteria bacterium]
MDISAQISPTARGLKAARDTAYPSSRQLLLRLFWIYVAGGTAGVGVTMLLALLGYEFTVQQWIAVGIFGTPGILIYTLFDLWLIARHYRPLGDVLTLLDQGRMPDPATHSRGLACALNLPFLSFVRISLPHACGAAATGLSAMLFGNWLLDTQFAVWQIVIFNSTIVLFAAPAHAIVEFFALSRALSPVIRRLSAYEDALLPEDAAKLFAVRLRNKLSYLAVFVSTLPTIFIAASIILKLNLLVEELRLPVSDADLQPIWLWIGSAVLIVSLGSLVMSVLTANEVTRSARQLVDAMKSVEKGELDVQLTVTGTDEYAEIFRGFNLMITGLRDEVAMLELTHDLSRELHIDTLIARIMGATTELLDADRATLLLHDPKPRELWSRYADGLGTTEIRIPDTSGVAGDVFMTGITANLDDPYSDPRFNQDVDKRTGYRTMNMLCMAVPNKSGERIAVIQVLNKQRPGGFTAKDETRLMAFSSQIAITLENANLFDEVLTISNYNENIRASSSNGILTVDMDGIITTANQAALDILRTSEHELINRSAIEWFEPHNQWIVDAIDRVRDTGARDISVDTPLLFAEGRDASVNLKVASLHDQENQVLGTLLLIEDISNEQRVKATMARFMSKEVADQLLASDGGQLEGKSQRISILFSDIRGFTGLSESLGATGTVSLLNEYFEEMVEVVFRHRGILDKYIGDAIMALFGAPFTSDVDADNAVAVANEMMAALRILNQRRISAGGAALDIGIGIGTGEAVIGNIGSTKRLEYTAIGDCVNMSSRLEGATKQYGVPILISEFTVADLRHPAKLREIDLIRVKGKDNPVAVFEALDHYTPEIFPNLDDTVAAFNAGMRHYRSRQFSVAQTYFKDALNAHPGDKPSRIFLERCAAFLNSPPPANWDGVWTMTDK